MTDAVAYVDGSGKYAGHFGPNTVIPSGLVPVPVNPTIGAGSVWNGTAWVYPPTVQPLSVLDASTLAAALITKGVLVQTDLNSAVSKNAGVAVATAISSVPVQGVSQ